MSLAFAVFREKSRLKSLLAHFSIIDDPREPWRVAHPLGEVLLLVVCASMADCDHYDAMAAWGEANLVFLRRYLPYEHGAPGGRWLTLLMNRISPALFSAAFTAWVRETWPDRSDLIAIDGKTSRRSHDRADDRAPLHLVSAFATTSRLVLGQEAVEGKANELAAIPVLLDRLADGGGLKGALVSIDAIATNAKIAQAIKDKGADYLLAVKANQPTLRKEMESAFAAATDVETSIDHDKGHGRIERRTVSVIRDVDWLDGERRFPGELRLPHAATLVRVQIARRTFRPQPLPDALLRLLGSPDGQAGGPSRARPLGHREPTALDARRRLRRRPVPPAKRPRRQKHGRRQALRHQSHPHRPRARKAAADEAATQSHQAEANQHQASQKNRRMDRRLPRQSPRFRPALTRIRSPEPAIARSIDAGVARYPGMSSYSVRPSRTAAQGGRPAVKIAWVG